MELQLQGWMQNLMQQAGCQKRWVVSGWNIKIPLWFNMRTHLHTYFCHPFIVVRRAS